MIPSKVQVVLEANQLAALTFESGSTPTSEMAAAKINCLVGQIAKSMLFKGKDGVFRLFVCPGDRRVDNKKLKNFIGVKARMATAHETFLLTDFKPGAVCPFGIEGIEIFIDCGLASYPVIYPAAGTNASGVPMTYQQLQSITNAVECDIMI
ncbi:MAG: YbaK/EbsC family protein [Gammaproteobacteria bacterium]|nr:YbaK/EbsC family protein [Gammaproteobacteria bacterium]